MIHMFPKENAGRNGLLLALLATMQPLDDDDVMPVIEDFPAEPVGLTQDGKRKDARPRTAGR